MLINLLVEVQRSQSRGSRTCQLKLRSKILGVRVEVALAAVLHTEPIWDLWVVDRRSGSRAFIIDITNRYPSTCCKARHIVARSTPLQQLNFRQLEMMNSSPEKSRLFTRTR